MLARLCYGKAKVAVITGHAGLTSCGRPCGSLIASGSCPCVPLPDAREASALLEQNEPRSGQHALLSSGQAPAGFSLRQVADDLDDLDQIP